MILLKKGLNGPKAVRRCLPQFKRESHSWNEKTFSKPGRREGALEGRQLGESAERVELAFKGKAAEHRHTRLDHVVIEVKIGGVETGHRLFTLPKQS